MSLPYIGKCRLCGAENEAVNEGICAKHSDEVAQAYLFGFADGKIAHAEAPSERGEVCECGHGKEFHWPKKHGNTKCRLAKCPCTAYRPAKPRCTEPGCVDGFIMAWKPNDLNPIAPTPWPCPRCNPGKQAGEGLREAQALNARYRRAIDWVTGIMRCSRVEAWTDRQLSLLYQAVLGWGTETPRIAKEMGWDQHDRDCLLDFPNEVNLGLEKQGHTRNEVLAETLADLPFISAPAALATPKPADRTGWLTEEALDGWREYTRRFVDRDTDTHTKEQRDKALYEVNVIFDMALAAIRQQDPAAGQGGEK